MTHVTVMHTKQTLANGRPLPFRPAICGTENIVRVFNSEIKRVLILALCGKII